jgi:hypothetical protein
MKIRIPHIPKNAPEDMHGGRGSSFKQDHRDNIAHVITLLEALIGQFVKIGNPI